MTQALDMSIVQLLDASRDDADTIKLELNDRSFGFHVQQAIEKLLKALIGGHAEKYEFTHDLAGLFQHVANLGEKIPVPVDRLARLTDYAGIWRYEAPEKISVTDRDLLRSNVNDLRNFVISRLKILRPGFDWNSVA